MMSWPRTSTRQDADDVFLDVKGQSQRDLLRIPLMGAADAFAVRHQCRSASIDQFAAAAYSSFVRENIAEELGP
jgi:hypothetical protein